MRKGIVVEYKKGEGHAGEGGPARLPGGKQAGCDAAALDGRGTEPVAVRLAVRDRRGGAGDYASGGFGHGKVGTRVAIMTG